MDPTEFVTVKAVLPALPLPPNAERASVTTDRLIIRAFVPEDVTAMHVLWGKADWDMDKTKKKLAKYMPPGDSITFNYAICLRSTGELIGCGGCHSYPGLHGWPEVGYRIRDDLKGRGYATEFLRAWLDLWAELPRTEREVAVQRQMMREPVGDAREGSALVDGRLIAITLPANGASRRVLEKCGFEFSLRWTEPDLMDPDREIDLSAYFFPPATVLGSDTRTVDLKN